MKTITLIIILFLPFLMNAQAETAGSEKWPLEKGTALPIPALKNNSVAFGQRENSKSDFFNTNFSILSTSEESNSISNKYSLREINLNPSKFRGFAASQNTMKVFHQPINVEELLGQEKESFFSLVLVNIKRCE